MLRTPPHILVTTPESLYLLLTAERSRERLQTVRTVIVDEIHAVIGARRGAHLALSLERLAHSHVSRCSASASPRRSGPSTKSPAISSAPTTSIVRRGALRDRRRRPPTAAGSGTRDPAAHRSKR